jgi:hypothetical protein
VIDETDQVDQAAEHIDGDDALVRQREFLIRSLDDLEAERAAGNIDAVTYDRLHGDYTARTAAVLRALAGDGIAPPTGPPPVSGRRRALTIGGVFAFAIAAAIVLAITISPRLPGQTVTGGVSTNPKAAATALKNAARDHPNDYTARIEYARSLLQSDPVGALTQYTAAGKLHPKDPEPPTYIGWILGLSSGQVGSNSDRAQLISRSLEELALAHRLDARYPDAYVFEGLVRDRFANDPEAAVPLLKKYLQLAPDGAQASLVRSELTAAEKAAEAPTTTTTG